MKTARESIKKLFGIINTDEPTASVVKLSEKDPFSEDDDSDVDSRDENEQSNPFFKQRATTSSSFAFSQFQSQIEREIEVNGSMQYSEYAEI